MIMARMTSSSILNVDAVRSALAEVVSADEADATRILSIATRRDEIEAKVRDLQAKIDDLNAEQAAINAIRAARAPALRAYKLLVGDGVEPTNEGAPTRVPGLAGAYRKRAAKMEARRDNLALAFARVGRSMALEQIPDAANAMSPDNDQLSYDSWRRVLEKYEADGTFVNSRTDASVPSGHWWLGPTGHALVATLSGATSHDTPHPRGPMFTNA